MIRGTVTADREAVITLEIVGSDAARQTVPVVIDTGFNGFLTLPRDLVDALHLPFAGNRRATLGDGSVVELDMYLAVVVWNGQERDVLALQADGGPLVGMALLYGSRVLLDTVDGGPVTIETLP